MCGSEASRLIMSLSFVINTCPHCGEVLLDESPECPECHAIIPREPAPRTGKLTGEQLGKSLVEKIAESRSRLNAPAPSSSADQLETPSLGSTAASSFASDLVRSLLQLKQQATAPAPTTAPPATTNGSAAQDSPASPPTTNGAAKAPQSATDEEDVITFPTLTAEESNTVEPTSNTTADAAAAPAAGRFTKPPTVPVIVSNPPPIPAGMATFAGDNLFAGLEDADEAEVANAGKRKHGTSELDIECPSCGAHCRRGVVRCWKCKQFMRPESKVAFERLVENDAAIERATGKPGSSGKPGEIVDLLEMLEVFDPDRDGTPPQPLARGDVDRRDEEGFEFELSGEVQLTEDQSPHRSAPVHYTLPEHHVVESSTYYNEDGLPVTDVYDADAMGFDLNGEIRLRDDGSSGAGHESIPLLQDDLSPMGDMISGLESYTEESGEETFAIPSLDLGEAIAESDAVSEFGDLGESGSDEPAESGPTPEDELLQIAMQELSETESPARRKKRKITTGFIINCPNGCKIRAQEWQRGRKGKCPKCRATYTVPKEGGIPVGKKKADGESVDEKSDPTKAPAGNALPNIPADTSAASNPADAPPTVDASAKTETPAEAAK